jgi:hypothetical protein
VRFQLSNLIIRLLISVCKLAIVRSVSTHSTHCFNALVPHVQGNSLSEAITSLVGVSTSSSAATDVEVSQPSNESIFSATLVLYRSNRDVSS